jgi:GT2 family glycosyltransferase
MIQNKTIVITPVKNSLENTLVTINSIKNSNLNVDYYVYDDYSDPEISKELKSKATELGYQYIHLSSLTDNPSPNYFTVLKDAQKTSIQQQLPLIIVESDVEVNTDTFDKLLNYHQANTSAGMIGAITVDYDGKINFPYLKFKDTKDSVIETYRSLSFCCTFLSLEFLEKFSFENLDQSKDWFDTSISYASIENGFKNYVLIDTPVLHKPHGSRPWKQLKYTNPLKYYWLKFTKRRDKI